MIKEKKTTAEQDITDTNQLYLISALVQEDKNLETLKKHVGQVGTIVKEENLGTRQLAYPINKHNQLTLVSVFFNCSPSGIAALEQELRHEEEIERYLLTTWKGDINSPKRKSARKAVAKEEETEN